MRGVGFFGRLALSAILTMLVCTVLVAGGAHVWPEFFWGCIAGGVLGTYAADWLKRRSTGKWQAL